MKKNLKTLKNKNIKPTINEQPEMIILGIILFFALIIGFIAYLYFLHRISQIAAILSTLIVTIIYSPRFLIINKIKNKDIIEITDSEIIINHKKISLNKIENFRVIKSKPQVVFYISNKMVVFQEARFELKLQNEIITFNAIKTEKIQLMEEFFTQLIAK